MSKGCTPHFNDMVSARGGKGAMAPSHPGFKAPGKAGGMARGDMANPMPMKGNSGGKMPMPGGKK